MSLAPRRLAASAVALLVLLGGCAGASASTRQEGSEVVDDGGGGGDSASARILLLIKNGQFAEAQVLIQESVKGGLMAPATATAMLARIQQLNTKLGEIPARLQRAANFPAVLKEYTLHEIRTMLERRDYSVATVAQLRSAQKLIEESERLMEKAR
jgi:hypothetical protein